VRQIHQGSLIIDVAPLGAEDDSWPVSIEDLLKSGAAPYVERLIGAFIKDGGRVCVSYDPTTKILVGD
jgi:hypothetical protein